jgi:DNA-binding CsgD family transcriptional regulator
VLRRSVAAVGAAVSRRDRLTRSRPGRAAYRGRVMAERPRTNVPAGSDARPPHTLRGRSTELGVVVDMLRAVARGRPAVLVLRGEPGIGKTALLRAAVEQAGRFGFRTAYTAAHEDDRVTPLASLGPALRFGTTPLIDSADFMDLAALHDQPLWLAERLAMLLERRAQDGPVLVALDDAQWSDPLTGFALRVLPKRLLAAPIAWLLATRPVPGGGPAEQVAAAATPEVPVVSVELAALTEDAVLAVAADRLGGTPEPAVLRRLAEAHGNPFLTVQLLAGLFEPGAAKGSVTTHVPSGLLDGVRRRIAATSAQCRELVRTAAVLGPSFLLTDVAALLDEPLVEAIDAGLLVDDGSTVQFRHELLREAVYEDLPPSGRHAVHRAFADRVLAEGRGYAVAAPHVLAIAKPGDAAAADVLRRAAHELLDTMATTSVTFIRQAFELTSADDPDWGEIGVEAVEILGSARQFADATRFADMLLAARVPAGLHARVRLLLLPRLWATGQRAELADRAREPAGVPDLDARLAGYRALAGGTTIETHDDPVAAVLATTAAAECEQERGNAHARFTSARIAAQSVTGYGAPEAGQLAVRELVALARLDDIDGALRGLGDSTRFANSWQAPQLALLRAQLTMAAGRVGDAASAAATATELMAELHDHVFEPELRALLASLALLRGDSAGAGTQLAAAAGAGYDLPLARAALADDAAAVVSAVRAVRPAWPEEWLVAAACSAHRRGDGKTVRAAADVLAEDAGHNPDVASVAGAHLLVAALSTKDYDAARSTLRESPRALLVARGDEEFGRFALDTGDRGKAVAALDAARDRYAGLGATAPATRVQRILQAAGVRRRRWAPVPQRPESGWAALTDMERRVALLIADGHTNRSAAEELVLSPSTISTHLRAVFSKLGVHSRVQLANLVLRKDDTTAGS